MPTIARTGFAFLLFFSLTASAQAVPADAAAAVDALCAPYTQPRSPGCAVAVIHHGTVVHQRGYGLAQLEHNIPISPTTVFHVASMSKQFTAMCILLLAEEGKLSLDDDVRKYIPELHDFGRTITIRQLLHHTSGLRDQWELVQLAGWRMEDVITERDILGLVFRQRELNFQPGQEHLYCNTGYTLLAHLVQRVTGQSLRQFAHQRLFQPLGMNNTHFHDNHQEVVSNRAYCYGPKGDGWRAVGLSYANVGATSLFTTVEDLVRWDQNFQTPRVGSASLLKQMVEKGKLNSGQEIDYAAGLMIGQYRGLKTVEHSGADAAFRCNYMRFPQQQLSIIILANTSRCDTVRLTQEIADIYLGDQLAPTHEPTTQPTEIALDSSIGEAYLGEYRPFPNVFITISRQGDQMMLQFGTQEKTPMFACSSTEFFLKVVPARITFARSEQGQVTQLTLCQGGHSLTAPKVHPPRLTAPQMQAYAGDYYSQELGVIYAVSVRDGQLVLRHCKGEETLRVFLPDQYDAPLGSFRFTHDGHGKINGFQYNSPRIRNLRFQRVLMPHDDRQGE